MLAAIRQAKEASEMSPEDEDFQQEYKLAKAALKQAQKEARDGNVVKIFLLSVH